MLVIGMWRPGGNRTMTAMALAASAVLLSSCGAEVGDIAAALGKASSSDRAVASEVTQLGAGLKTGAVPDSTLLAQQGAQLQQAQSQVQGVIDKGSLNTQQADQAATTKSAIEGTKAELATEQTIATDAGPVASGSSDSQTITEKFVKRARSLVCKAVRRALGQATEPDETQAQEESTVATELGSEPSSPTVVETIVTDGRRAAAGITQNLNNAISLNAAGRQAILEAALARLSC